MKPLRLWVGVLAATVVFLVGHASAAMAYTPVAWPAAWIEYKLLSGASVCDAAGDENPGYADISSGIVPTGTGTAPSVFLASDGANVYFRLRIAANPFDAGGNFSSTVWLVMLGVNGTHVVSCGLDAKGAQNKDFVYVCNPDASVLTKIYDGGTLVPGTAGRATAIGGGEYYVDWQVPIAALNTVSTQQITPTTPIQVFYGSSQNDNNINKDYMAGSSVNWSILSSVKFNAIELTKTLTEVTGPNPPEMGVETTYTMTVTAANSKGSHNMGAMHFEDAFPTGVAVSSVTTETGTISYVDQSVSWDPADLVPTSSTTATIQVKYTPTGNQVGQTVEINPGLTGTATNLVTGTVFNVSSNTLTIGPVLGPTPDLLIKRTSDADTAYAINGTYQTTPTGGQALAQDGTPISPASYSVKIENDSATSGKMLLKAVETAEANWSVVYRVGTTDITADIKGAGYTTATLATGGYEAVTVEMTPNASVGVGTTKTSTISAYYDGTDATVRDVVQAVTTAAAVVQPDLLVKQNGEAVSAYAIDGTYQTTPSGNQLEAQSAARDTTATYQVKLENDGNSTRGFVLKGAESAETGWAVVYKVGTTDIGTDLLGAGYATGDLAPGASVVVTVEMTPSGAAVGGTTKTATLSAYLDGADTTVRDVVRATTTVDAVLQPDLLVSKDGTAYTGAGVYDPADPTTQSQADTATQPAAATYPVKLVNNGNTAFAYVLKASGASGAGWTVAYKIGATDITTDILSGGGYTLPAPLAVGTDVIVTVTVTPDATVASGATKAFSITAYKDAGAADPGDSVQGVTTAGPFTLPDLMASADGTTYTGAGVYNPADATAQSRAQTVPATTAATYQVKLVNNGNVAFAYVLKASGASGAGWTVTYKIGATDITTDILGAGYTLPAPLAVGADTIVTVTVTPDDTVANDATKTFSVTAYKDAGGTTAGDSVQGVTTCNTIRQPDLLIKQDSQDPASFAIADTYQLTPAGDQISTQAVRRSEAGVYQVKVQNNGNTPLTYVLKAVESAEAGWGVTYTVGGTDVSAQITGGGYTTASLSPGSSVVVTLSMTPGVTVATSTSKSVTMSAYLDGSDTTVRDVVKAVAVVSGTAHLVLGKTALVRTSTGGAPDPARTTATTGDRIAYTITFTNDGEDGANTLVVTDSLPSKVNGQRPVALRLASLANNLPAGLTLAGVQYSNDGGSTWTYTPTGAVDAAVDAVRWSFSGTLSYSAPNNTGTLSLDVVVQSAISAGTSALNAAAADYQDGAGSQLPAPLSSVSTPLSPPRVSLEPKLTIVSQPGAVVLLAHTLGNLGVAPDTLNLTCAGSQSWPITLYRDTNGDGQLDPGDTSLSDSDGDGRPDVGVVAANGTASILVRVAIPSNAAQGTSDAVTMEARPARDPDRTVTVTDTVSLTDRAVLSVSKYIETLGTTTSAAPPGAVVTYVLVCTNRGASQATGVVIQDTVPPFSDYLAGSTKLDGVAVTPEPYSSGSRLLTVAIGSLAPGASKTVTFQAVVR